MSWLAVAAGACGVAAAWAAAAVANARFIDAIGRPAVARVLAADAFLAVAILAVLATPIAGVRLPASWRAVFTAFATFIVCSLIAALAVSLRSELPAALVLRSHAVLAIVGLALLGVGAIARAVMRHELDAAAAAVLVAIVAATAILVGGPRTANLSERTIDTALLANPLIAVTSAAEMDLLRSEVLYVLSPISHRRFTYPAWPTTAGTYGAVALCAFAFTFLRTRQKGPTE